MGDGEVALKATQIPNLLKDQFVLEHGQAMAIYASQKGKNGVKQYIAHIALVVKDYDEAIDFYTKKLDFSLIEDTTIDENKRWVMITPPGAKESCLLLAKATNERQLETIGNQTGGRVGFFLFTDNFWRDYKKMIERGINFITTPTDFNYGTVAVFEDLYGNLWDLIEPTENNKGLIKEPNNDPPKSPTRK